MLTQKCGRCVAGIIPSFSQISPCWRKNVRGVPQESPVILTDVSIRQFSCASIKDIDESTRSRPFTFYLLPFTLYPLP
jgi:hypothetical protein